MPLTKTDLEKLEIAPELKASILELFGEIETRETALDNMRKKVPTDSQTVVNSVDHTKFLEATKELETLKQKMADKLASDGTEESDNFLYAFRSFFR